MTRCSYDDFQKLDIRIGEVLSAEKIPDTDRLLKLSVDLGEEAPRTIVSGIAEYVEVEELIGMKLPFVANLEPRMIKGILSQGMIMAASNEEEFSLLQADPSITAGSRIK